MCSMKAALAETAQVRLLLDTRIALWVTIGTLPARARQFIGEADAVFVSAISPWEIAIKASHGRIRIEPADLLHGFEKQNSRSFRSHGSTRLRHAVWCSETIVIHSTGCSSPRRSPNRCAS